MWRYENYRGRLKRLLKAIETELMGQNVPLSALAPGSGTLPPDKIARSAAQQLTLQIGRIKTLSDKEVSACYWWLRSAAVFLLLTAEADDCTVGGLIRLAEQEQEALQALDQRGLADRYAKALPYVPPRVRETLSEAVWLISEMDEDSLQKLSELLP